jgi:transcription antitermination factor NusG
VLDFKYVFLFNLHHRDRKGGSLSSRASLPVVVHWQIFTSSRRLFNMSLPDFASTQVTSAGNSLHHSEHYSEKPWYAIRTYSNREKIAETILKEKGYAPFLPVYSSRRCWSDRVVTSELPLFPGYVFCRFDYNQRGPIVTSAGVVSIIAFGGQPAPLLDEEIEAIRAVINSGFAAEPAPFLREGERIRITHGPLKSLEGRLVHKKSSWRLVISVELLQRSVSVEVDPSHIEALAPGAHDIFPGNPPANSASDPAFQSHAARAGN